MRRWILAFLLLGLSLAISIPATADDLTGAAALLCAAQTVSVCTPDNECMSGPAGTWNIPQFILVNLGAKRMSTTQASGENRSTPIANMERKDGLLFLQGIEMGRAFSIQIDEETGDMSAAVARGGVVVAVFGACTPSTAGK